MFLSANLFVFCWLIANHIVNGRHVVGPPSGCQESDCHVKFHPELRTKDEAFIPKIYDELETWYWRSKAQEFVVQQRSKAENKNIAKNIILFLGDGMSMVTQAATRVYLGGEEKELSFEKFPYVAISKTYCIDAQVADSACTSTAYLGGVKGNIGTIGVNAHVARYSCDPSSNRTNHVGSIAEWAMNAGKDGGFVTTTRVTHASPTGVFGHIAERYWETDLRILQDGCNPNEIDDITEQLVFGETGKKLKVIFGGGRRTFLNSSFMDEEGNPGYRMDGKNLIEDWKNLPGGERTYLWNKEQLTDLDVANTDHVLGLFATNHCAYQLDINDEDLDDNKPSLADMVDKAIDILSKNSDGFFLFVEGGRIDLAHHDNLPRYALEETVQFARAIEIATKKLDPADTLFVVTADHSHALSYAGYAKRGNDILSTTDDVAQDNMKYMTLSYGNGQGYYTNFNKTTGHRVDPESFVKNSKVLKYPGTVPLVDETHGGDDVGIYALGPYAHLFQGTIEQNMIPHIMAYAACIGDGNTACK